MISERVEGAGARARGGFHPPRAQGAGPSGPRYPGAGEQLRIMPDGVPRRRTCNCPNGSAKFRVTEFRKFEQAKRLDTPATVYYVHLV